MSININITKNVTVAGIGFRGTTTLTADINGATQTNTPVAQPGTLTVRTDNDTGTLTMTNGSHGILTGDRLDLYWSGGRRRGMTVGTVSGTSVPIDLGAGDNLPAVSTAIKAAVPVRRTLTFTGNNLKLIAMNCDAEAQFTFVDSGNTELWHRYNPANLMQMWYTDLDPTNPFAGVTCDGVYFSHSDITTVRVCQAGFLAN